MTTTRKKTRKIKQKNAIIIILCTIPYDKNHLGIKIAKHLINTKLASCVKIVPNITSIYKWKNNIQKSNEIQLIITSHISLQNIIFEYIKTNHSYDIPELMTIPTMHTEKKYLLWITDALNIKNKSKNKELCNYKKPKKNPKKMKYINNT